MVPMLRPSVGSRVWAGAFRHTRGLEAIHEMSEMRETEFAKKVLLKAKV